MPKFIVTINIEVSEESLKAFEKEDAEFEDFIVSELIWASDSFDGFYIEKIETI